MYVSYLSPLAKMLRECRPQSPAKMLGDSHPGQLLWECRPQDPAKMQATLQQFQKQSDIIGMQEELLDDALTDAFDCDDEEEDAVVSQVMDELGMDMAALMAQHSAPAAALPGAARAVTAPVVATSAAAAQHDAPCKRGGTSPWMEVAISRRASR